MPPAAIAISIPSVAVSPPSPLRIASTKMRLVSTAWVPAMTRLHEAPSARCDTHTTIASMPQMNHVPRCGRVVPRTMSRT